MKKGDRILLLVIAVAVMVGYGVLYYRDNISDVKAAGAVIKIGDEIYREIPASRMQEDDIFTVEIAGGGYNTIEVSAGRIRVKDADCTDRICVNTGWIDKPGEIIVCLPHKLTVQIMGQPAGVDSVAY
ncbi:NusG domain II-containing protein [Mahella sp.]|uniref:NusG domain II-containing protein n=1 Tax=Mahella sp. TaxID=2798721 RepID=UPI0025BDA991|nr:NusG domain II-containing protein [Mahella sp.]MBZ4665281.1 hypothetical protein [Mahella sp.]MDK2902472.1 hypothetical protein [Clostridiales bacterium]